ncbi:hypothetical protein [Candidatus Tokpelaia sp.]|uniref:hypothetical protein n=1 Tax=Candidatus Tokpelaia sp. TaxID=2233777 RepID=UPI001239B746|nr:hypothetical protein [Candidatus Tokpelaia sp.]
MSGDRNRDLLARIDKLEAEQQELLKERDDFRKNFNSEVLAHLSSFRKWRIRLLYAAIGYGVFVNSLLLCLWFSNTLAQKFGSYGLVSFIVVTVSSSVLLLGKCLSGAFRTYDEMSKDSGIPSTFRPIFESFTKLKKDT